MKQKNVPQITDYKVTPKSYQKSRSILRCFHRENSNGLSSRDRPTHHIASSLPIYLFLGKSGKHFHVVTIGRKRGSD
jgi:hypothetical protein